ncbi:4'-phosphopantetheinyl transferase family protein [Sulfitobacter sp. JB4-11]|uniref:4'-phosphopantetheinyl transferase family protein n=1 Tax=Sulfitobacter rhodophyticola TaxID=3238304 RepID=UPI0035123B7F
MPTLCAAVATLFDAPVAVAGTDPRAPQPRPHPQEAAHLGRAIAKRQQEFAAGRAMARQAMADLTGVSHSQPILADEDRAPIWPAGWQGSISHKSTLCLAVVGQSGAQLGLDVEEDTPLAQDLIPTICSGTEIAQFAGPEQGAWAKLIFSAKEAAYKAQYPLTREVFGFHRFDVFVDVSMGMFSAAFTADTGIFEEGDMLMGRFLKAEGHLVTGVTIGQSVIAGS